MKENNSSPKFPVSGLILYSLAIAALAFYAGSRYTKSTAVAPAPAITATATFVSKKSDKPELKFFVMSFCPYGNQIEDALRPVFDLINKQANITPHYIFEKITNLSDYCKTRAGDITKCSDYVKNNYFRDMAECQKTISDNSKKCNDDNGYIKSATGAVYASLHGRQEANEDVREICAWNQVGDNKKMWWDFIGNVNKNCTAQNADSCWEDQAKQAGLDTTKITECFNKDGINLIDKEIALTDQYKVQGSPTVLINDVSFPPETAYTQDGKGTLKIGDKVATQDKFRTPNVIKEAICNSFNKTPAECKTILNELTGTAPAAGGCGN